MAYAYSPTGLVDEEEQQRRDELRQPAATKPDPASNADPFQRTSTGVVGNPETRFGATLTPAVPTRSAVPDAFESTLAPGAQKLLVPSPAIAEVPPPAGVPRTLSGASLTPVAQVAPTPAVSAPAVPSAATPIAAAPPVPSVTPAPFSGTLPGSTPSPTAQPVAPRPILEDEEDAFRRRRPA